MKKVLSFLFLFLPVLALAQTQTPSSGVVAVVNGEEITKAQLDRFTNISGIVFSIYRQYPRFAQLLVTSEEGKALLKAYERDVLESLITWRLIVQEARRRGITVPEEKITAEVDKTIDDILKKNNLTQEELAEILVTQRGQTLEDFRAQLRREIEEKFLMEALRDQVTADISVSKDEIEAYYNAHKDEFTDDAGKVKPLDEVAKEIAAALSQEKRDTVWGDFLKKLREEADVKIYL